MYIECLYSLVVMSDLKWLKMSTFAVFHEKIVVPSTSVFSLVSNER